ncbi:hypothetical protein C8J57DRAFT_1227849 [Mycena rebaudengoi]|nr:hypothetical protein C8J57DRAFT_1227849 [Mycena rebaudengoi]
MPQHGARNGNGEHGRPELLQRLEAAGNFFDVDGHVWRCRALSCKSAAPSHRKASKENGSEYAYAPARARAPHGSCGVAVQSVRCEAGPVVVRFASAKERAVERCLQKVVRVGIWSERIESKRLKNRKENYVDVPRAEIAGFYELDAVRKVAEAEYQVGGTFGRCGCGGTCEDGKDGPKKRLGEPQQMVRRAGECGGNVGKLTRNEIVRTVVESIRGQVD